MAFDKEFQRVKNVNNADVINDFLIRLGKDPEPNHLEYIDFFIKRNASLDKIKINLFYVIGRIGGQTTLGDEYLEFLEKQYYLSDRWERKEIIIALNSILSNTKLIRNFKKLILSALSDAYTPIRIEAIKLLCIVNEVDEEIQQKLLLSLNMDDEEYVTKCIELLNMLRLDANTIYSHLNSSKLYAKLKKDTIKNIILIFSTSLFELEKLHEFILKSEWIHEHKNYFLKEIETILKILLKTNY